MTRGLLVSAGIRSLIGYGFTTSDTAVDTVPGFLSIVPCHRGSIVRKPGRNRRPGTDTQSPAAHGSVPTSRHAARRPERVATAFDVYLVAVGALWATKRRNVAVALRQCTLPRPAVASQPGRGERVGDRGGCRRRGRGETAKSVNSWTGDFEARMILCLDHLLKTAGDPDTGLQSRRGASASASDTRCGRSAGGRTREIAGAAENLEIEIR